MKKSILLGLFIALVYNAYAQVEVKIKSLDLESINKHKNWNIIDAGVDPNNKQSFVKFAQLKCNTSTSANATTVTTTFQGVSWKIDKLYFDNNFNYVSVSEKEYASSAEAVLNNEYVYGKKFTAVVGGNPLQNRGMPSGQIDNSFLGTYIVAGGANMTGFKIGTSFIGCKSDGQINKWGTVGCIENAAVYRIDFVDAKEQKGQRWIPVFNHAIPNGGHILFNTSGVNTEGKQHYIFRKYDKTASVISEKVFTFDYQCLMFAKEIEMAPGIFDYVFVTLPINYKKSDLKVNPANQYEYIRIDGTTFETRHRLTFAAPKSQWQIKNVFEKNNEVYLIGFAGKSSDEHQDFSFPKESDFPNFQMAKIQDGKLAYATSVNEEQIKAAIKNVTTEKAKPDMSLKLMDIEMNVINGKFIMSGQQAENGKRNDAIINAVFTDKGELEVVLVKSAEYSKGNLVFSASGKTMHWLIQDVTEYNKWDSKTGVITAKDSKQVLTALSIATYNLENKSLQYQNMINEDWGLQYKNHILYETDTEVVLLGGKLTKKAKESELIFVSIKK